MLIEPGAPPPGAAPPGTSGRCHRQHRVLHGDAAERAHRSLVHAGQCRDLSETLADDEALSRVPDLDLTNSEAAKTVKLDPTETIAMERTKRAQAATNPLIVVPEPEAVDPPIRRAIHRGGQRRNRFCAKDLPAVGPESHGSGSVVFHAPQLPYLEGSGRMVGARAIAEFAWSIEIF